MDDGKHNGVDGDDDNNQDGFTLPAPLARISQSQKEETCLVTVYSHKLDQRVGLIVESACVNARTLIVTQECYY